MESMHTVPGGKGMKKKTIVGIIVAVVLAVIVLILLSGSTYTVNEGYTAALYTLGKLDQLENRAGLHFKLPFVQAVSMIDIREQSIEVQQNAYTKDTQTVESLAVKVNYCLDASRLDITIREIGVNNVYSSIIEPNVLAATRDTIGQYTADALIGHRSEITQIIQDYLDEKFQAKGVVLLSFTIQNIDFEDSFEAAVRRKVEAEQKALEAQNQTKEAQELGKQQVIRAQADADAIKAKADADAYAIEAKAKAEAGAMEVLNKQLEQNPAYIEYLKVTLWNGQLPMVESGDGTPIIDMRGSAVVPTPQPAATSTPEE